MGTRSSAFFRYSAGCRYSAGISLSSAHTGTKKDRYCCRLLCRPLYCHAAGPDTQEMWLAMDEAWEYRTRGPPSRRGAFLIADDVCLP